MPLLRWHHSEEVALRARASRLGERGACPRLRRCRPHGRVLRRRGLRPQLSRFPELPTRLAARPRRIEPDPGYHLAAVALVCAPGPDALLVIRRAERDGDPWSGQMGLPGGRHDAADGDLLTTVIREVQEEVGLSLEPSQLAGLLDDLTPNTVRLPRIMVRPFVFVLPARVVPTPNHEVAGAHWIAIDRLRQPGIYGLREVMAQGETFRFPGYALEEGTIWGLTERILTPFLALLDGTSRPTLDLDN